MLSNRIATINAQAQFRVDDDTWPPDQLYNFTPLLLVHHKGQQRMDQAIEIAKMVHKGDVTLVATKQMDTAPPVSKMTKEVSEILAPLEKM